MSDLSMEPSQITDETYAGIPALLKQGMTKAEIAAMFGVKLSTLVVLCSRRGISLRKNGPRKLVLPLSDDVLKSLRDAARRLGKGSMERLVSDLLQKIASDDLYKAVLDEEATPDTPVTSAPQNDPTPPPEQMAEFVRETAKAESAVQGHGGSDEKLAPTAAEVGIDPKDVPALINDDDRSITAGATTTATMIGA
jgi:hypothetical protein